MAIRVDVGQLVEPNIFTDAQPAGVPVAGGQNTAEGVQGDGSLGTPIKLDINGLTQETSIQEGVDFVVVYDVTAGAHVKVLISDLVPGALQLIGEIANANTNPAFPASPDVGDVWIITTTAGTVGGVTVEIGDRLIYSTSGWFVVQTNMNAASQAETETGTDAVKYTTPSTVNPNNYTAQAGAILGTEKITTWSPTNSTHRGRTIQEIIDSVSVPMSPSSALVNKGGDDLTGVLGEWSKPFLTIQAAIDAGATNVHIYDGDYTENLIPGGFQLNIILYNANLIGNITTAGFCFLKVQGIGSSSVTGNMDGATGPMILRIENLDYFQGGIINPFSLYVFNITSFLGPLSGPMLNLGGGYNVYIRNINEWTSTGTLVQSGASGGGSQTISIGNIGRMYASGATMFSLSSVGFNTAININSVASIGVVVGAIFTYATTGNGSVLSMSDCVLLPQTTLISGSGTNTIDFTSYNNTVRRNGAGGALTTWSGAAGSRINLKTQSRINRVRDTAGRVTFTVQDDLLNVSI